MHRRVCPELPASRSLNCCHWSCAKFSRRLFLIKCKHFQVLNKSTSWLCLSPILASIIGLHKNKCLAGCKPMAMSDPFSVTPETFLRWAGVDLLTLALKNGRAKEAVVPLPLGWDHSFQHKTKPISLAGTLHPGPPVPPLLAHWYPNNPSPEGHLPGSA